MPNTEPREKEKDKERAGRDVLSTSLWPAIPNGPESLRDPQTAQYIEYNYFNYYYYWRAKILVYNSSTNTIKRKTTTRCIIFRL